MPHDYRPLIELAMNISDNVGYASSHLQQLCILEGDIGLALNELKQDSAWVKTYFDAPLSPSRESYREALLTIMRNMIFRVAQHPDPIQWQYDSFHHLGMYNTLLLIDTAARMWNFTESEALDRFAPPFLDDVYRITSWLTEDFSDKTILPLSPYHTETDRTHQLTILDGHLTEADLSRRLTGYILYRQDLLDHIVGNQPIGDTWEALSRSSLSRDMYDAMVSDDLGNASQQLTNVLNVTGLSQRGAPMTA